MTTCPYERHRKGVTGRHEGGLVTRGQRLGVGWWMGPQAKECRNLGSQRGRKGMATGLSWEATAVHVMLSHCEN